MNGWRVYQYTLTPMDTSGLIGLCLYGFIEKYLQGHIGKLLYGFIEKHFQGFLASICMDLLKSNCKDTQAGSPGTSTQHVAAQT